MWLPMWVFDGNGFTMACLAVWIRNVALRWGLPQWRGGQERWLPRHPTAPVNVARISVATSGTDFTAPEADFAALIRAAHLSRGSCRSWDSAWSGPGAKRTNADQSFALASPNLPMTDWSDRHCHAS